MSVSLARAAAFDILLRIERERAFSSVLLPQYEERLAALDRGLCHELVLGTLRRQTALDRVIDNFAKGKRLDPEVRIAARLGLLQLHYLDRIPPRAAINESVELVKRAKKTSASGFVNALLRRAQPGANASIPDGLDGVAVRTSHPDWLIARWAERLGPADAEHLAQANNLPAKIAFRVIGDLDAQVAELIAASTPSTSVEGCYIVDRSTPLLTHLAAENRIYLQDEASQMVARAVVVPPEGRFLDVCAAPGGKTGLVAHLRQPKVTVAGDLHASRAELLRDNCRRQHVDVSVARYDAAAGLPLADATFDAVLVDAPCSGTGTIRHNPEIRYFLEPADIAEVSSKQRLILTEASKAVKKGGLLVYSTCSLEPEEGENVATGFLSSNLAFEQVPPLVPERFHTGDGFARTWPHRDSMDGFFIAAFRRR
ncbi:MAG TPA: 16S rRNA (cytosine(967)-C(5))-methyltransferase RsmB [Pyrinomonadaceae bacterium]|nr:16S rRNA (cytosine(967)-C(5))-methyltransferase RsmB [Pyrinomonadaceae bacterium]